MPFTHEEAKKFAINFAIVGVTSSIAKTITAPFDRVKLILQAQGSALQILTGERKTYTGIVDCFVRLPREQGFLSLWRGNGVSVMRYFPTQALNFAFNDFLKHHFYREYGKDSPVKSVFTKFLAGGVAGLLSAALLYPLEFCQTRISLDIGSDKGINSQKKLIKREYNGLTDCISKVCRADGYLGLYRGFGIAICGMSLYRASYFGLFDVMKRLWAREALHHHHEVTKPPLILALVFAQCVTCLSGIFSYPLDTVGRRLMMEAGRPKELRLFDTAWGAAKVIYKREGLPSFYRGLLANCLRGMSGALVLVFYDEILHYTKWKDRINST